MRPMILISTQDAEFFLLYSHILDREGLASQLASDAAETLHLARTVGPTAVIVDCRPGSPATLEMCRTLRTDALTAELPIAVLVGRGAEHLYVDFLQAGVLDLFVRPVAPSRLLECIRSIKPVEPHAPDPAPNLLSMNGIELGLDSFRVSSDGIDIHLGPIEFRLLRQLMLHAGQVLSRGNLIGAAWPDNIYVEERTVDVHIGRLRRSLKVMIGANVIRAVRSAGYVLDGR